MQVLYNQTPWPDEVPHHAPDGYGVLTEILRLKHRHMACPGPAATLKKF